MKIQWTVLPFDALNARAIHDLFQLRVDVFVVEQSCIYREVDGLDLGSEHILGYNESGELVAYARLIPACMTEPAHIGRVIVRRQERGQGMAHQLLEQVLEHLSRTTGTKRSVLEAQTHLESFYARHGFERIGPDHDLDGIPHVTMERKAH
jgi:ElaA protein